jgi:uncharacterized protein (TIGR03663 family)
VATQEQATGSPLEVGAAKQESTPTVWVATVARSVTWEVLVIATIVGIAFALRMWDLGWKVLHHDESLHAVYSHYLYIGRGYVHTPMMHGPWQFHIMAFSYLLFGATDFAARLPHAIFGTILVWLPWLLRDVLGRTGAIVTAALLAVSPGFLYFSRFAREDAFAVTWSALMVVAMWRYLQDRKPGWLFAFAAVTSLMFSTKENSYIIAGILGLFLVSLSVLKHRWELPGLFAGRRNLSPAGELTIILSTLILPLFTGFELALAKVLDWGPTSDDLLIGLFAVLFVVSAVVGLWWNPRRWLIAAAIFWGIFFTLHTTFFANLPGAHSGAIGAVKYWVEQQEYARGGQPWYYYFLLLGLYEFLVVGLAVWGAIHWTRRRDLFGTFLIYWIVLTLLIYGYTSEKMPWLLVHVALPFVCLAGYVLGRWIDGTNWRDLWSRGMAGVVGAFVLVVGALLGLARQVGTPAGATVIEQQRELLSLVFVVAVAVAAAALAFRHARSVGWAVGRPVVVIVVLSIFSLLSVRTAFNLSYQNPDTPIEMAVYTQSSPDIRIVMREIERIAFRTGEDTHTFVVAYGSGVSWPMAWYLRDYRAASFFGTGVPAVDAPVVLVGVEDGNDVAMRNYLGTRYVSQRLRLRWWFPEDYRDLTPSRVASILSSSTSRQALLDYFLHREVPSPLGSTDFVMFVRRDLAAGAWLAPQVAAAQEEQTSVALRAIDIDQVVGDASLLGDPKGVAIGTDGRIVVADTRSHRIQVFDATGQHLMSIGERGQGPGQFNEPWGVAVDASGNVYVADTWNHRVQKFDATGSFLLEWGQQAQVSDATQNPAGFFGPRGIAAGADGSIFVTDTGNHRVIRFDDQGRPTGVVGGRGGGTGRFQEPVGVALDIEGNVYVADAWNRRIVRLDRELRPTASFPVISWRDESPAHKPYLGVDASGHVYATDPVNGQLIVFDPSGTLQAVLGTPPGFPPILRTPSGIAIDAQGRVHVTDSLGRVARLRIPQ